MYIIIYDELDSVSNTWARNKCTHCMEYNEMKNKYYYLTTEMDTKDVRVYQATEIYMDKEG